MNLSGNTILITGGSAGIGLALAKKLVELDNKVIITGRSEEKLAQAANEVVGIDTLRCDASDAHAIANMAAEVKEKHPQLNVLINNAGIFLNKNLSDGQEDLKTLTAEVDINVSGPIRTVAALVDVLIRNKATIINVSSALAFVPLPSAPIYCATKAALHSYTLSLRAQMADHGVRVVELMPPAVRTDLTADLPDDAGFKIMSTDDLVAATIKGLRADRDEIRPGQAKQLHWMSRIAPRFINGQLAQNSKAMIPE